MSLDIISRCGSDELASVFVARLRQSGELIEMVESLQPPHPIEQKWVLIISTMKGCPVGCKMCDAGGSYHGRLSEAEMLAQVEYLVRRRFGGLSVPVEKFKIQFARMGEPALCDAVLDTLERLPRFLDAPGLMPSFSTVAPAGREAFFHRLLEIKNRCYPDGRFQMQFSLHSTDERIRDSIIPVRKWSLEEISAYIDRFYRQGDRLVTLNFIACEAYPVDPRTLMAHFDPQKCLIKVTPLNPTFSARANGLENSLGDDDSLVPSWIGPLRQAGFSVLISIGEREENRIGSNCGQYVRAQTRHEGTLPEAYQYRMSASGGAVI